MVGAGNTGVGKTSLIKHFCESKVGGQPFHSRERLSSVDVNVHLVVDVRLILLLESTYRLTINKRLLVTIKENRNTNDVLTL